jgi:tight adherence protein C
MLDIPLPVLGGAVLVVASLPILAWAFSGTPRQARAPLPVSIAVEGPVDERQVLLKQGPLDRVVVPAVRAIGRVVRRISPAGWIEGLERRVRLVGASSGWTIERALLAKLVLGLGGLYTGTQLGSGGATTTAIALTVGLGVVGYVLPDVVLRNLGRQRQTQIARELPDTLDQLTISVEAGLGFDAALMRVSTTGTGPLAEELRRMLSELKVGVGRTEAFRHLIDRTDVPELRHFALALKQAEEFGLPTARVLRIQAAELRTKRRQRAEEAAMKIPVKIVFPLVLCIFPALFVILLGPAVIRIMRVLL